MPRKKKHLENKISKSYYNGFDPKKFRNACENHIKGNYGYDYPKYNFQSRWNCWRRKPPKRVRSMPEKKRSPSPFSGTEEYNLKKIQETSDMIKKKLMMPDDETIEAPKQPVEEPMDLQVETQTEKTTKTPTTTRKIQNYNVEEIHQKIITHITKLNHGKKVNLICANSSEYDVAIQQIHKQKRLELSKALRDMCSNHNPENSDVINSIIPDIGINLEQLPIEVIQELSSTLNLHDFYENEIDENNSICDLIKTELIDFNDLHDFNDEIKKENFDSSCLHEEIHIKSEPTSESDTFPLCSSIATQTNPPDPKTVSIQTDLRFEIDPIENLDDAVKMMFSIDAEIQRLTKIRQNIFTKLQLQPKKVYQNEFQFDKIVEFAPIPDKILVIKVIDDTLVAASESGKVHFLDVRTGETLKTVNVTQLPITALCTAEVKKATPCTNLYLGSSDTKMYEIPLERKVVTRCVKLADFVQCLEPAWNCIFIGTMGGSLIRYSLKVKKIKFEERVSNDPIMVLKATQEGSRRVLLVGMKNAPVCVRDAMSGLHLRVMNDFVTPTVYSLVLENSLVYCGTTSHDILVFNFNDGSLIHKHTVTNSKGIGCMKVVRNLLFASCHNGNIYVYNVKNHKFVGAINGPGGVILSMEIVGNLVIVGTMSFNFKSILIPQVILEENKI